MSTEFILKLKEELKEVIFQDRIKETLFEKNPLEVALKKKYDDVAIFYIENGADIHFDNDYPILYAVHHDNRPMIKLLLEKGANRTMAFRHCNSVKYIDLLLKEPLQFTNIIDILRNNTDIILYQEFCEKKYITEDNVMKVVQFCTENTFKFLCEKFPDVFEAPNKNLIDEVLMNIEDLTLFYNYYFCDRLSKIITILLEKNTLTEKSMEFLSNYRDMTYFLRNYRGNITKTIMKNILNTGSPDIVKEAIEKGGNLDEISEKELTYEGVCALRNVNKDYCTTM